MIDSKDVADLFSGKFYELHKMDFTDGKRNVHEVCREIGKVLRFGKKEVEDYIQKNGYPPGLLNESPGDADGSYLVKEADGKFHSYGQERAARHGEKIFRTRQEAIDSIVSGFTELYFG